MEGWSFHYLFIDRDSIQTFFSFSFRLYDDGVRKGSVIIQGLEEVQVSDKQEVYRILERGSEKRRTAETKMNANSSRSHTVRFLKGS